MLIEYPTFKPRHYQTELLNAFFIAQYKRFFYLCHRRAGKDFVCWQLLWGAACQKVGTYLYLFPLHAQARKVIWRGLVGSGQGFMDMIPKQLVAKINSVEMVVTLVNGSVIQLGGTANINHWMGTNPLGIVLSEYALHSPLVMPYLSPILQENGGFLICQTTPRGKNHAYNIFQGALDDPTWFVRKYTIDETKKIDGTPVITYEQIEQEKRNGISDELIRQEWFLDFNVGVQGAYYTKELDLAEYEKRICMFDINPRLAVFTSWDLGISNNTVIWFWQVDGDQIKMINCYAKTGEGLEHFIRYIEEFRQKYNIKYQQHWAPHDISVREFTSSARSRQAIARDMGINFLRVPNVSIEDGIQAVKSIFRQVWFHKENCRNGIDALKEYRREYDEIDKVYNEKPYHNWCSDFADSFRYFAVAWRHTYTRPELNQPRKFQNQFYDAPYGTMQSPDGRIV